MGRHNLKHPLLPVSPRELVHCVATPALNCGSTVFRIHYPPGSLQPTPLVQPRWQWRPAPAHAPCSPERERETDEKQRNTLHNEISHTRASPQMVSPEHQSTTQQTNYTRIFFDTRPIQRTRILNANRKWEITRRMETLTVVTKIYGLSVRLTGM